MQFRFSPQKVCEKPDTGHSRRCGLSLAAALLSLFSLQADAAWEEKYFNPQPAQDDVVLPMPCAGAITFRQIRVPLAKPLEDYAITVGQEGGEWGYLEQARPAYIAGSFSIKKPTAGRYFLLGKYELSELQYQSVMASTCPTPTAKLRLPQTMVSWFDAVAFADKYNQWLRKNALAKLPEEDGVTGFVRLPTEEEWEFATRGGLAVSPAEFRDLRFPMPEGINGYAWFAGAQSANGKLQLTGLLKPNPVGLHDTLGNVDEMVFEPFRLNKLDRLHGQAGGFMIRGGNYLTPQAELRSALRQEEAYYRGNEHTQLKTAGFRLALVAPTLTSRERIKQIEGDWKKLGVQQAPSTETSNDPVSELSNITADMQDEAVKKQLEKLRSDLRANIQARDEQRDKAIRAALQLGAFLCTKLKDDGQFYDYRFKYYNQSCAGDTADSDNCIKRKQDLDGHQKVLDFILNYYADTIVDAGSTYDETVITPQLDVTAQQMTARSKNNLHAFLAVHWSNLQGYLKSGKIARRQWLDACKST